MPADPYAMNGREIDTVLAALRNWQIARARDAIPDEYRDIAANSARPLDHAGTERIFERLLHADYRRRLRDRLAATRAAARNDQP